MVHVNAHATATADGGPAEARALRSVLGPAGCAGHGP
nr:hypothetical protein [Streptomyces sp. XY152]